MNSEASSAPSAWAMNVPVQDDEFNTFLDFNDMDLNFSVLDDQSHNDGTDADSGNGNTQPRSNRGDTGDADLGGGSGYPHHAHQQYGGGGPGNKDMMDLEHQARLRHQQQFYSQQPGHFQRQGIVPPTPNSLEMQAGSLSNMQMMGGMGTMSAAVSANARAVWEYNARKQQQENMVFTPLVSPAVTPLDTQFARVPEYTVPGEYFSPLTSPALNAQHSQQHRSYGSSTSEAVSPVDMDIDSPYQGPQIHSNRKQKSTKRDAKPQPQKTPTGRIVRQSPAMKPQRNKKSTSTHIPSREIADIMEGFVDGQTLSSPGRLNLPQSQGSSETGSISPEPLTDVLMPPPATRPSTAGRSPNLQPQDQRRGPQENPATPASLMRLQKNQTPRSIPSPRLNPTSAGVSIPNSPATLQASSKPDLQLDTQMEDDQTTPTLTARNGPASASLSAMSSTPMISPAVTPLPSASTVASPSGKNGVGRQAQTKGKKRNGSSQASPALRPKISPSIKPLLPEGTKLTPETSALLLASKSNYQNILEGNHLPGVSYPEALSENLTSKRTSHKIAEQGRRNRINTALQEIAALLPQSATVDTPTSPNGMAEKDSKEGKDGKEKKTKERSASVTAASSSKANTVEMAIEYIKALQSELQDVKGKLAVAERQLGTRGTSSESTDMGNKEATLTVESGDAGSDTALESGTGTETAGNGKTGD